MLITYLSMLLILIVIGYYTKKINTYCLILFTNIQIASEPLLQDKLNNYQHKTAFKLANNEFNHSMFLFYSLIGTFANLVVMTILVTNDTILDPLYIVASALLTANILTEAILLNTLPSWLFNWSITILSSRDAFNLSIIQNRLIDIKTELTDIISGKDISPTKLNELKHEGIKLSQTAEYITKQIQERSQYQN